MPDVTDVGQRQSNHPPKDNSLKKIKRFKNISKEVSDNISVKEKDLNVVITKTPKKEDETCNDLMHMHGPCTEASIISNLKVRFTKNILQVRYWFVSIPCSVCINFKTWVGPVLVKICPPRYEETQTDKDEYLDSMVLGILDNNILTNKSQTVIPLGMQGAGKTWTCRKILRLLLKKCGYGEQTDMVKHVEAAESVIRPMITARVSGSKMSTRMVIVI